MLKPEYFICQAEFNNNKLLRAMPEVLMAAEFAAVSARALVGSGKKNEADDLAVKGMRDVLSRSVFGFEVVIGEGEMDEAPMLYIGEKLGGGAVEFDLAVDPLEGTNLCANNMPNSLTTLACGLRGSLLPAPDVYMQKIAAGRVHEAGVISLEATLEENIKNIARYKKKDVREVSLVMLERPRHKELIQRARALGARVSLISDGDIYGVLATCGVFGCGDADLYVGSGGAPEGVLAACALKSVGGFMEGKLIFEDEAQKTRAVKMAGESYAPLSVLSINDMVKGEVIFAMSGVTDGALVRAPRLRGDGAWEVESIVFSTFFGVRKIQSILRF